MLKINFYEVDKDDKRFITKSLKGKYTLSFFVEPLTDSNVDTARDADIVSVFIYSNLGRKNISALPKLKLIATRSTGFNHVDLKTASRQRCTRMQRSILRREYRCRTYVWLDTCPLAQYPQSVHADDTK